MDRIEFCNMLVAAKEHSGKTTNTVSFDLRMQWATLRRFEKGINNPSMNKVFEYLNVVNAALILDSKVFTESKTLVEFIVNTRTGKMSQRQLANAIDVSYVMVARVESGKSNLTLDVFLKIIDVLGYTVQIENK